MSVRDDLCVILIWPKITCDRASHQLDPKAETPMKGVANVVFCVLISLDRHKSWYGAQAAYKRVVLTPISIMIWHRTSPDPTDVVFAHWLLIIAPKKVVNSFIKMIRKSSVTSAIKYRCETVFFFVVSLTVSEPRDPVSNQVYCLFSYLSLIICHLPIQFESERAVINSKRRTERNNCAVIVGKNKKNESWKENSKWKICVNWVSTNEEVLSRTYQSW